MTLTDQDFRRERRVTFTTRASLATFSGNGNLIKDASTIDLSESGAKIRFSGQIQPGQVVELFLSKHPEPCRVVWTAPGEATQELIVGLQFTCPLPDPQRLQTSPSSKSEPIN
jgi:hypothetical protein